jgi:hypothetical protein
MRFLIRSCSISNITEGTSGIKHQSVEQSLTILASLLPSVARVKSATGALLSGLEQYENKASTVLPENTRKLRPVGECSLKKGPRPKEERALPEDPVHSDIFVLHRYLDRAKLDASLFLTCPKLTLFKLVWRSQYIGVN